MQRTVSFGQGGMLHTDGKKITNSTIDRVLIAKLLNEDKKLYIKKTNSPKKEWGIYLPREFSIAETQIAE